MSEPFDWEALRSDVADVQRPVAEDTELLRRERARLLLVARGVPRRVPARRWAKVWPVLAAAALLALTLGGLAFLREAPLSFRAGSASGSGQLGAPLVANASSPLPVQFSDGTLISLGPAAHARVLRTNPRGADVVLEQGTLSLAVVHYSGAQWHIGAGPFSVLVTGTKFDVAWNAAERTFTLALHEGSVLVSGPTLGATGRRVSPGESLRVAVDAATATASAPNSSASAETAAAAAPAADAPDVAPKSTKSSAGLGAWKPLALEQRYAEALAAAEADGFDATCRTASAPDLVLLGNAARFTGATARAEHAFRLARARFAGTHQASMAAFFLGRIAYDQLGNRREAVHWFQSYLQEEPAGGLAREAAGRLLEAERALGDQAAARASAQAYLQKYPSGPHAGLARNVLSAAQP